VRTFLALVAFTLFASAATYTLKAGDTLGVVAHRFGVSVSSLASANHIKDPNRVYAGEKLVIPGAIPGAVLISATKPIAGTVHVVKAGETLSGIARSHHVTVVSIVTANGLKDANHIKVGQHLAIGHAATWVCPVAGATRFIDDFGAPRPGHRKHMGIDLLARRGVPVVATVSGMFRKHPNHLGGNAFYLDGDDGREYYGAHLATYVRNDGRVRLGETLGTVGDSGDARGGPTHLHFEVLVHHKNLDPYTLLRAACPRP